MSLRRELEYADEVISENHSLFTDTQALSKITVVLTALTDQAVEIEKSLHKIAECIENISDRLDEAADG